MTAHSKEHPSILPLSLVAVLMFQCLGGCAKGGEKDTAVQDPATTGTSDPFTQLAALDSATHYLTPPDLDKFRPGRSRSDILKDLRWRADYFQAADCDGTSIAAINYRLIADGRESYRSMSLHAIFADDKFVKFIRWQPDIELVPYERTTLSQRRRQKAGDYSWLTRVVESEAVNIADLKKEAEAMSKTPPPRKQIDPGLTAVYFGMRVLGLAPGPPPREEDYEKLRENVALRDQFNAARLNLGMTESEVEAVLKAKPLESGKVEAGRYQIYGSNKSFNINDWHHFTCFSNILVIFREGKAVAISSIESGYDWRERLGVRITDLSPDPKS